MREFHFNITDIKILFFIMQTVQAYGTIFQVAKYSRRCWELFNTIATSIDQSSSGRDGKLLRQTVSLRLEGANNNQCMFGPRYLQ